MLLEHSGQTWVDPLRVQAFKRMLAQPRSWFDVEVNSAARLNECLDRNAEEMRNLLGRFAGPTFTPFWMLVISIVCAFLISLEADSRRYGLPTSGLGHNTTLFLHQQ